MHDAFGNSVHCSTTDAVRAYDRAVDRYLHAFPGALEATEEALAHDTGFALAHALRGLFARNVWPWGRSPAIAFLVRATPSRAQAIANGTMLP